MLLKLLRVDETSRTAALNLATLNLFLTTMLISLLTGFGIIMVFEEDSEVAIHTSRLILVESSLHLLFYPFTVGLFYGTKTDKFEWVRVWIKATIIQAVYMFLLNIVAYVYITVNVGAAYGVFVVLYTLINEGIIMELIVFINNYYRAQVPDKEPEKVPEP